MERWNGKIAIVTGGSEGIGKAIVEKLVYNGMKVVACARNMELLSKVAVEVNSKSHGKMVPYKCDISKEPEILNMFEFIKEKFGTLHVCVNNAAMTFETSVLQGKTGDWQYMFDLNVIGLSVCTRESVKLMKISGVDDGHVINIGSLAGHKIGNKPIYSGTKFALHALTEGLRMELRAEKSHIRSTNICPGFVVTDLLYKMYENKEDVDKLYNSMECLKAEDIADCVVYVLGAPAHVEVNDILVRPTEQML
uniref:Dehydrogenase/reductase SDR family member 11 n=1 Tax=Phallusia mammillata TaxID=59560 RepID=A0A6F9DAB7_9ASCI|nr:dehydrogenase/reductase SDR family member 11-like [Phallusia mammillata]